MLKLSFFNPAANKLLRLQVLVVAMKKKKKKKKRWILDSIQELAKM